jgi:hypothetical protein
MAGMSGCEVSRLVCGGYSGWRKTIAGSKIILEVLAFDEEIRLGKGFERSHGGKP